MRALSLFSGVGGLDLAAEAAGIEIAAMCEIEPFCRQILGKRWPSVPLLGDVREIRGDEFGAVDIVFGGFPCQDLSVAGRRAGLSGERSCLWFEMARLVREIRPAWVLAENVRGAVELALDTVCDELEAAGYEVRPVVLPAAAFGAPHRRERLFVVAARHDVADGLRERPYRSCAEETAESVEQQPAGCDGGEYWPTPTVNGDYNRAGLSVNSGDGLATAVRMWATPNTMDYLPQRSDEATQRQRTGARQGRTMPSNLREQVDERTVAAWRTPNARDYHSPSDRKHGQQIGLNDQAGGQLNPDWVEMLMGFPRGWTDPDVDEPEPWQGWPAPMGAKLFATPNAADGQGSHGGGQGRSLRSDIYDIKHGLVCDQYSWEPPRTVKGGDYRAARIQALGNAVVPQQAYPLFRAIAEMEGER